MRDYAFGNLITNLRTELGFSQFQLGKLIGVSDKAVSKWENGNAKPRMATCCRLADILGVSLDELLSTAGYARKSFTESPAIEAEAVSHMEDSIKTENRLDPAKEKRIELHVRTGMSAADGIASAAAYIRRAAGWGHEAIAVTDYGVTHAFPRAFKEADKQRIKFLPGCEGFVLPAKDSPIDEGYSVMLFATNRDGMTNLNRLISRSHMQLNNGIPCMLRAWIDDYRSGLLLGSACDGGEVINALRENASAEELQQIASFYDYLEIQPIENEEDYPEAKAELQQLVETVIRLGDAIGKPVVAVSNARYLDPEDDICRAVVRYNAGIPEDDSQPGYYFRTTAEMLDAFRFLGEEKAREVVIHAPRQIADKVENGLTLMPHDQEKFYPVLPEAQQNITNIALERAHELYGAPLPEQVETRLQAELAILARQNSWVIFEIARRTAECLRKDGYPVGSRGSVSASLVAYLCRITAENPLPPHYVCAQCHLTEFDVDHTRYRTGIDLPVKICPVCGCTLRGEGFNLPAETLFGLNGEREPDIDLNIPEEMRESIIAMARNMFGEGHTLYAGTISSLWESRAQRYTRQYISDHHLDVADGKKARISETISDIKSRVEKHPGGLVFIPAGRDVNEFTPVQYLSDDSYRRIAVTHYSFQEMNDALLKMDMLGHAFPALLQMLCEDTKVDLANVPLHDEQVISLFRSPEALNVTPQQILCETGTCNIPDFSSETVQRICLDLAPTSVEELIRISGYAHGTDVWKGNAQEYIQAGIATCIDCPSLRDDIFNDLRRAGLPKEEAYSIMWSVWRGRGLTPDMEEAMRKAGFSEWYLESCRKMKYMFPRAHATAYVVANLQLAWFKL